ncbi:hypothetical protein CsSME_00007848 [Camellia sinensis var. sinensis]
MILKSGFFHADPHPRNILICKGSEVALLDYGQVKDLPDNLRLGNANLVIAIADKDPVRASESYRELGTHTLIKCEDGQKEMLKLAQTMFDTKLQPGVKMLQPFSEESSIKKIAVQAFPEELFSVLRMVHLLRGLSVGLEINYSCAEQWRPIAEETLYLAGRLKGNDLKTGKCSRGLFKRIFGSGGIVKTEYMQAQIDLEVLWCSNSIVRSLENERVHQKACKREGARVRDNGQKLHLCHRHRHLCTRGHQIGIGTSIRIPSNLVKSLRLGGINNRTHLSSGR